MAILLIVGGLGWKFYEYKHPELAAQTQQTEKKAADNYLNRQETSAQSYSASTEGNSIQISVDTPINGRKIGVIEVGASGFNCFVVDLDKDKNWELVSKEFGESLAYEGFITVQDVQTGLKKYLSSVFEKGVAGRNAHFVVSSGAMKNPKTTLIIEAIEKMGYVVNKVSADQEGKYALRATLPKAYRNNSFVVDMGSGNTKISWYEGDKLRSVECSGAKYYQDNKSDQSVYKEISDAVAKVPAGQRTHCFIIGGVPFKLAKQVRKGEERFTLLSAPDEYSAGDDVKMRSGLNIYNALYTESKCENFVFDWDANFTIGFLMTLN